MLNSKIAVKTNIAIIRTFKKLREFSKHDKQYKALKKALDELITTSELADIKVMGFLK